MSDIPIAAVMELAGGWQIVLAVLFLGFFVIVPLGWYTRKGSGIYQHAYGKIYSGAPAARTPSQVSGCDETKDIQSWTRGTR